MISPLQASGDLGLRGTQVRQPGKEVLSFTARVLSLDKKQGADRALWDAAEELRGKLIASFRRVARERAEYEDVVRHTCTRLIGPRSPGETQRQDFCSPDNPGDEPDHPDLKLNKLTRQDRAALERERAILRAIMQKLPPQTRRVFRLNRVHGLEHQEIAVRLNMRISTVKDHLIRAAKIYAHELEHLKDQWPDGRDA